MGFFDKLVDAWTDWDFDWDGVKEGFKTAGKEAWGSISNVWAGTFNLIQSTWEDDLTARAALSRYGEAFSKGGAALGGLGKLLDSMPATRQLVGTADWLQSELVKRPMTTGWLMNADAMNEFSVFPFFDPERWRKAYNTTTYVTPGQALTYNLVVAGEKVIGGASEIERRDILREHPTFGILRQDPKNLDPRNRDNRKRYYDNPVLKTMSGTLDAAITLFADPTIVGSKVTMFGKARYWSKTMDAAAVQGNAFLGPTLAGFMDGSKAYGRTKEWVANAPTEATVQHTLFNNHYRGNTSASILYWAAKGQEKYEELGGVEDLYDLSFRALYGDSDAFDALAEEAPRIADTLGTKFANYSIGHLGKQYGLGDEVLDAQWDALRETREQAWIDAFVNGHGLFGQLAESVKSGGFLTGQSAPQLRRSSKWRVGVHQWMRNAPLASTGMWSLRRARYILPSSRTGRMLDLQNVDGGQMLRANLEHSRLSQAEIDQWVSGYQRANSRESRFAIYNRAENAAFKAHATHFGMTQKQVEDILPHLNRWRAGNRQMLAASRRFMSTDVRKEAQNRLALGHNDAAARLNELADDLDAAIKRGDQPAARYHIPDEDGNLAVIPEDAEISTAGPVLISQHADVVPMVDFNVLDNALWWHKKGKVGDLAYGTIDATRAALDSLMTIWKISAILRPGYIWRALSDENGRTMATMGAARTFSGAVGAAANTRYNAWSYGRLVGESMASLVTRRKATGRNAVDLEGEVVDEAPAMQAAPEVSMSQRATFDPEGKIRRKDGGLVYSSYERALADGVLDVDDFLGLVESHGQVNTLSPRMAEVYHGYATAGSLDEKTYRRHAVDAALTSVGRGVYTDAAWQQNLLGTVQSLRATKAAGEVGKGMLVDPMTGVSPKTTWAKAQEQFTFTKSQVLKPEISPSALPDLERMTVAKLRQYARDNGMSSITRLDRKPQLIAAIRRFHEKRQPGTAWFSPDGVYDYIADNMNELLKPGSVLAAYQTPAGLIHLSVARRNGEAAGNLAIKPSGGRRAKLPILGREGRMLRNSGMTRYHINTAVGPVEIHGAFEGQGGDLLRAQTSSRGPEESWTETLTNIEHARLMAKSGRWVDVSSDKPEYREAWQRAVNLQLANDDVARQFIAGKSVDDVIAWMHNTSKGRAYNARMGPWQSRYAEQVQIVKAMVDTYLPLVDSVPEASMALRKKALAGKATLDDFEQIMAKEDMPRVHGAGLEYAMSKGPWIDWFRKRIDTAFKYLSDIPNDKFVRHPFAAERYRMHVEGLLKNRAAELDRRGDSFTQADLNALEKQARFRANADVKKYLYESAASLDLAKAMRLIVPFGSAIGDSTTKWGVVLRENPHTALQLWKIWTFPERNGLVQDEDGNQLRIEDGKEVWYQVHPQTGAKTKIDDPGNKRLITFRLPSWVGPEYAKGMRPVARIDKDVFRTFLDMPTAGPLVTVPANEFALSHPEFSDKAFVRSWILPFGPSEDWARAGVPGNVRNVWETFKEGEGSELSQSTSSAIMMTEIVRHARGERADFPTYEEVRSKAAGMMWLRFGARFGGVSAQFMSPYQPYVDYYHTLQEKARSEDAKAERGEPAEPFNVDERFYNEMGPEYFALTQAVTRNVMGLPATIGAFNQHKKLRDLMDRFPELSPLIAGAEGAGEFNRSVYEAQKQTPLRFGASGMMRKRMDPYESWEDVQRRRGWVEYSKFADAVHADMVKLGVTSLQQKAAEPVKLAKERWIQARMFIDSPYGGTVINPWYQDYTTFDTSKMTSRLHQMRQIIEDDRVQGRDDIRGLIDYLDMRGQFKQAMASYGYKTLDSKKAEILKLYWDQAVFRLKNQNLSFASLYDRWLTNDEHLDAA